ncbi:MAG: hypothetical protein WD886_00840, partial [Burkholderiales bacterium]
METNEPAVPAAPVPAPEKSRRAAGTGTLVLALVLVAAALGASGWVVYDSRVRLAATQEELARRLRAIEEDA